MKLFGILSLLLSLGLLADAVVIIKSATVTTTKDVKGMNKGFQMKYISEQACKDWVEQCVETECVRNMIFHGLCALNPDCCDKDPVELCKKKGGQCAIAECGKDDISLGKCFGKSSCCKRFEKTTITELVIKNPLTPGPFKKPAPASVMNKTPSTSAAKTDKMGCPDLEVSEYP